MTESKVAPAAQRITMLPTKGALDPDLALELVMDALRREDEGRHVPAQFPVIVGEKTQVSQQRRRRAGRGSPAILRTSSRARPSRTAPDEG